MLGVAVGENRGREIRREMGLFEHFPCFLKQQLPES